jgi:hypothetical protein
VTGLGDECGVQARWAAAIPRFYFPGGRPVSDEVLAASAARVDSLLGVYSGGLTIPGMKQLVKEVRCGRRPCPGSAAARTLNGVTPGADTGRRGVLRVAMGTWRKGLHMKCL